MEESIKVTKEELDKESLSRECVPPDEVCRAHIDLVKVLRDLIADIQWMIRIGKWLSYGVGAFVILTFPLIVGYAIHQVEVGSKISAIEARQMIVIKDIAEIRSEMKDHLRETRVPRRVEKGFGGTD